MIDSRDFPAELEHHMLQPPLQVFKDLMKQDTADYLGSVQPTGEDAADDGTPAANGTGVSGMSLIPRLSTALAMSHQALVYVL